MKRQNIFLPLIALWMLTFPCFGQATFIITDPEKDEKGANLTAEIERLIKDQIFPQARNNWDEEICPAGSEELAGFAGGSFTKPGAEQMIVLYQYCQTGNGLGNNLLVLLEGGKISKSYGAESGWGIGLKKLPDINQNGLDEFAVTYGGGMHQGEGGTGTDILEFANGKIKHIGWFQESAFSETSEYSYKVWVKRGKTPVFYREKYVMGKNDKPIKTGKSAIFKLQKKAGGEFVAWK